MDGWHRRKKPRSVAAPAMKLALIAGGVHQGHEFGHEAAICEFLPESNVLLLLAWCFCIKFLDGLLGNSFQKEPK